MNLATITRAELSSSEYRRDKGKVKFFIYTVDKPCGTDTADEFKKRLEDFEDKDSVDKRDIDMCFLMNEYIKKHDENHYDIYHNRTKEQLFEHFKELQADTSLSNYDSFVFVFLTYMCGRIDPKKKSKGKDERLHFRDGKDDKRQTVDGRVHLDEIYKELDKIKELNAKPKILLVQADSVELLKSWSITKTSGKQTTQLVKIPHDADRLTILSTIPGRYFVPEDNPSFLIQTFVDVMNENRDPSKRLDFLSLTSAINGKVDQMIQDWKDNNPDKKPELDVPLVTSTLNKLLFLHPL